MAGCSLAFHEVEKDAVFVAEGAHHVEGEGEFGLFSCRASGEADDRGFHDSANGAIVSKGRDDFPALKVLGAEFLRVDNGLEKVGCAS